MAALVGLAAGNLLTNAWPASALLAPGSLLLAHLLSYASRGLEEEVLHDVDLTLSDDPAALWLMKADGGSALCPSGVTGAWVSDVDGQPCVVLVRRGVMIEVGVPDTGLALEVVGALRPAGPGGVVPAFFPPTRGLPFVLSLVSPAAPVLLGLVGYQHFMGLAAAILTGLFALHWSINGSAQTIEVKADGLRLAGDGLVDWVELHIFTGSNFVWQFENSGALILRTASSSVRFEVGPARHSGAVAKLIDQWLGDRFPPAAGDARRWLASTADTAGYRSQSFAPEVLALVGLHQGEDIRIRVRALIECWRSANREIVARTRSVILDHAHPATRTALLVALEGGWAASAIEESERNRENVLMRIDRRLRRQLGRSQRRGG